MVQIHSPRPLLLESGIYSTRKIRRAPGSKPSVLVSYSSDARALFISRKRTSRRISRWPSRRNSSQKTAWRSPSCSFRGQPNEALGWVERGRVLDREKQFRSTAAYGLGKLHRELLSKLGRADEALGAAWGDFRKHPSKFTYDDLMKFVPTTERTAWHKKALNAASGADLHSLLELFAETEEMERLADLVRRSSDEALEKVSHFATELAAKRLEKNHPGLAARLWRAQGMRIVDAKKSKYYNAALSNFERARDCYQRAELATEWERTVRWVCASHYRKTGFISGFQALAAGSKRSERPRS